MIELPAVFKHSAISAVIGASITLVMACNTAPTDEASDSSEDALMAAGGGAPAFDPCTPDSNPNRRCPTQDDRYSCPATEAELLAQPQAPGTGPAGRFCSRPTDGGTFDHVGRCYRQMPLPGQRGGNQCCYGANGADNCTGSYDLVSVASGVNPDGTCAVTLLPPTNVIDHCNTDVRPFCAAHALPGGGFGGPLPYPQPSDPRACTTPPPVPPPWSAASCQCLPLPGDLFPPANPPYVPPDICTGQCTAGATQCGDGGNITQSGGTQGSNFGSVYSCITPTRPPFPGPARCNGWFQRVAQCQYGCAAGSCNPPPEQQPIRCNTHADCPRNAACFNPPGICVYQDGTPATPANSEGQ